MAEYKWHNCMAVIFLLTASFVATNGGALGGPLGSSYLWWGLGVSPCATSGAPENETCFSCDVTKNDALVSSQEGVCKPSSLHSVIKGARLAIIDCQSRFNISRWNCSTFYGDYLFGSFISYNHTRETGILNAYFAAAAIYSIAEDCRTQINQDCHCLFKKGVRESDGNSIIYEQCSADYNFAYDFVKKFVLDIIETLTLGGKVDHHNVELGAKLINKSITVCRCSGISGTCSIKTCYDRTPSIPEVGKILYSYYGGAVRVEKKNESLVNVIDTGIILQDSITYADPSPNFCNSNLDLGTPGVADRLCDIAPDTGNSCNTLCCGYGYYHKTKKVEVEKCEFVWCCRLECNIVGHKYVTEYYCNGPSSGATGAAGGGGGGNKTLSVQ